MPAKQAKVFISHSSADDKLAGQVVQELERAGIPCWISSRDISGGESYPMAIMDATNSAAALVLILTRNASQSKHVCREVERAVNKGTPLITLKFDQEPPSKELEYFVSIKQQLDFTGDNRHNAMERLVVQLKTLLPPLSAESGGVPAPAPDPRRSRPAWLFGAAAVGLVVVFAGLVLWWRAGDRPPDRGGLLGGDSPAASGAEPFAYRAVVIGISDYKENGTPENEGWTDLPSARGDAEALAKVLEDTYGFTVARLFDAQADRSAILAALDALVTAGPNTAALIVFAGHGMYDEKRSEGYWIPADSRKTVNGRAAREDWIWNSTIQKIVGASDARGMLLIADACYAGTLFRPDQAPAPAPGSSRYLIASGGEVEVPDGGRKHSAFMKAVLDELQAKRPEPLTAQALGQAVRRRLYQESGREIAIGPLALPAARGSFVFTRLGMKPDAMLAAAGMREAGGDTTAPLGAALSDDELLASVLALSRDGATNAAKRLLAGIAPASQGNAVVRAVAASIDQDRRAQAGVALRALIDSLKKKRESGMETSPAANRALPRIVACIGPAASPGSSADIENRVLLCRVVLRSQIESSGRAIVVEREALEQVLQEMQLGTSDLADPRARLALGRLLPAGILMLGDYLPGEGSDTLILRLVDTETTQVRGTITSPVEPRNPAAACTALGPRLTDALIRARPVCAAITGVEGGAFRMAAGRFAGVPSGAVFELLAGTSADSAMPLQPAARGLVKQVNDEDCLLEADARSTPITNAVTSLWAREMAPDLP